MYWSSAVAAWSVVALAAAQTTTEAPRSSSTDSSADSNAELTIPITIAASSDGYSWVGSLIATDASLTTAAVTCSPDPAVTGTCFFDQTATITFNSETLAYTAIVSQTIVLDAACSISSGGASCTTIGGQINGIISQIRSTTDFSSDELTTAQITITAGANGVPASASATSTEAQSSATSASASSERSSGSLSSVASSTTAQAQTTSASGSSKPASSASASASTSTTSHPNGAITHRSGKVGAVLMGLAAVLL